ncbi:MAG: alanine-tRNA synthetase second additional domain-containing protein [Bacillota bacterium]|nr:alanine-tRNA synthetase second additional domain-containing protein [Bacillota bacterium]
MPYSNKMQRSHIFSTFYAPRGRKRIYELGIQFSQLYLSPFDKIIGVIGEPGSGKSVLIKGMFPGLELTNDDDGVNVRPLPLLEKDDDSNFFTPHTYHVDIRFEMGFTQPAVLAEAIMQTVYRGKRVIVEHFDLIYPFLPMNAHLLIGLGEEIIITRPNLFGPYPNEIYETVNKSLPYRLMAHTSEDLCEFCMPEEELMRCEHDDVKHGFIIAFPNDKPEIDIPELEKKVKALIAQDLPVCYADEGHITINGALHPCTGPRTHVPGTGCIKGFGLVDHFIYDGYNSRWLLVGCVGEDSAENLSKLSHIV